MGDRVTSLINLDAITGREQTVQGLFASQPVILWCKVSNKRRSGPEYRWNVIGVPRYTGGKPCEDSRLSDVARGEHYTRKRLRILGAVLTKIGEYDRVRRFDSMVGSQYEELKPVWENRAY